MLQVQCCRHDRGDRERKGVAAAPRLTLVRDPLLRTARVLARASSALSLLSPALACTASWYRRSSALDPNAGSDDETPKGELQTEMLARRARPPVSLKSTDYGSKAEAAGILDASVVRARSSVARRLV